jgi:hypothetical protein
MAVCLWTSVTATSAWKIPALYKGVTWPVQDPRIPGSSYDAMTFTFSVHIHGCILV